MFDEIRGRIATHRYLVAPHEVNVACAGGINNAEVTAPRTDSQVQCLKKCQDDTRQRPVVVGLAAGYSLSVRDLPSPLTRDTVVRRGYTAGIFLARAVTAAAQPCWTTTQVTAAVASCVLWRHIRRCSALHCGAPRLPLPSSVSHLWDHLLVLRAGEACICSLLALQKSPLAQETALLTTQAHSLSPCHACVNVCPLVTWHRLLHTQQHTAWNRKPCWRKQGHSTESLASAF